MIVARQQDVRRAGKVRTLRQAQPEVTVLIGAKLLVKVQFMAAPVPLTK